MNGAHDLGGMMGFGPVIAETDEPVFHTEWERRAFAVTLAMGALGEWNLDQSRHARETLPPPQYLTSSYFQIWLAGLVKLLEEHGLATSDELASGTVRQPARQTRKPQLKAAGVVSAMAKGGPVDRAAPADALYKPGDKIVTVNMHPSGHTRLARYLRGHKGEIASVHGCHVFPDSNAMGLGEDPHWLYSVKFSACELWGGSHRRDDYVFADLWEPYLIGR